MASVSLHEAVKIMNVERDACIFELQEGASSIFDSYERKKIHAYNLVIDTIRDLNHKGVIKWDDKIEYY